MRCWKNYGEKYKWLQELKALKSDLKEMKSNIQLFGGSYVKDTKDAHEKYNFKPEHLN